MTFDPTIPQPNDRFSLSQGQLLTNNAQLDAVYGVDHSAFSSLTDIGKHKQCTFPEQGADPATGVKEGALYTKDSGTQTELYFREESSGDVVQLTNGGSPNTFVKAFIHFDATGVVIGTAYNATVVKTGGGEYTITFTNPLVDANYTIVGSSYNGILFSVKDGTRTVNDFVVRTVRPDTGSSFDKEASVVVYRIG